MARFDTDDINDPKRFEMQIKHLEKNPKISVLGTWAKEIFGKGINDTTLRRFPISSKEIKDYTVNNTISVCHASCIFSRKTELLLIGGYPNVYGMEDYALFLKMIELGYLFENIPEYLYYFRVPEYHFFFNKALRVSLQKRWGCRLCQSSIFIYKQKRELGMVCGYREFMTLLRKLVRNFVWLSVGYSFSKEEPTEYKSLITAVVYFPLRFFKNIKLWSF